MRFIRISRNVPYFGCPQPLLCSQLSIAGISGQNSVSMRKLLPVFVCLLASFARAADYYHLARVVVTGSQRYNQDDLLLATGLKIDSQVTPEDLQNAANRLGNSGAFSSVKYLFKAVTGIRAVEADFQVVDAD